MEFNKPVSKSLPDALLNHVRVSKFISVGACGAIIETVIVSIITIFVGGGPLLAKLVGSGASVSAMFVLNEKWTFANKGDPGLSAVFVRWMKSHAVRAVGISIAFGVLYILTSVISFEVVVRTTDIWPVIANLIGISVGMVFNYVTESIFTWDLRGSINDI